MPDVTIGASASYAELTTILDHARRTPHTPLLLTDAQLVGLQARWSRALSAELDAVLEKTAAGSGIESEAATWPQDAVAEAWRELASFHDTLRWLIDIHEHRSFALVEAQRDEARMLALAAGISRLDDPVSEAVDLGRAYRELIRTGSAERPPARIA